MLSKNYDLRITILNLFKKYFQTNDHLYIKQFLYCFKTRCSYISSVYIYHYFVHSVFLFTQD